MPNSETPPSERPAAPPPRRGIYSHCSRNGSENPTTINLKKPHICISISVGCISVKNYIPFEAFTKVFHLDNDIVVGHQAISTMLRSVRR